MNRFLAYALGAGASCLFTCCRQEESKPPAPSKVVLQGYTCTVRGELVEEYEYCLDDQKKKVLHGVRLRYPVLGGRLRYREMYIDGELAGGSMPEDNPMSEDVRAKNTRKPAPVSSGPDPESLL